MIKIQITEAKPGMVLAQSVFDILGNPLFDTGHTLTQVDIVTLQVWGIKEFLVEGTPGPDASAETTAAPENQYSAMDTMIEEQLQRTEHRFSDVAGDELMERLKAIVIKQIRAQTRR